MEQHKINFQSYYDKHHREKTDTLRRNIMTSNRVAFERLGPKKSDSRLLDIGCGTGELLKVCKDANIIPFGIDISIEGLSMAKQYNIGNLVLADQEFLPFRNNCFEYITLISALEYCLYEENIKKALREVQRVSTKEAKVYIEARNGNFIVFKMLEFFLLTKLLISDRPNFKHKKNTIKAMRFKDLSCDQWNEILKKSGFEVEKIWKSYTPLFPGNLIYFIKTFIVNLFNLILPSGLCYRICYLCKKKD